MKILRWESCGVNVQFLHFPKRSPVHVRWLWKSKVLKLNRSPIFSRSATALQCGMQGKSWCIRNWDSCRCRLRYGLGPFFSPFFFAWTRSEFYSSETCSISVNRKALRSIKYYVVLEWSHTTSCWLSCRRECAPYLDANSAISRRSKHFDQFL